MLPFTREQADDAVRECLPAVARMAEGLVGPHAQACVQQEHALPCPAGQVPALRNGRTRLGLYLLEYVAQRGWKLHPLVHREAEAVRLSWTVIGVLSQDDYTHLLKRCLVEGIEDERPGRIAHPCGIFLPHKLHELGKVGLPELPLQALAPGRLYPYIHLLEP